MVPSLKKLIKKKVREEKKKKKKGLKSLDFIKKTWFAMCSQNIEG
jgi:hypothetical protein